nr:molybdopterin-dependent oxidoreductase [Rhodococcus sp. (in: high G+C Gram-positive bacteria)]
MPHLRRNFSTALISASVILTAGCSTSTDTEPVAATSTTTAAADVPAGSVRLGGAVENPITLAADDLLGYPRLTQAVTFDSSKGSQTHTYEGAALTDLLAAAVLDGDPDAKNPDLTFAILATGSDDYQATVSWGEVATDFGATQALVAYTEDGQRLDAPRLVVPGDIKGGRYVSDLTELDVVDLREK